jgi:hypothetical protein
MSHLGAWVVSAFQDLNDDHRCTAVPADEGGLGCDERVLRRYVELGHDVQQFTHLGETGAVHRVDKQPVVTDPMEAAGQHNGAESGA